MGNELDIIAEVVQLRKIYQGADNFAVDNLSFEIKKGQIFGLLGPNGAGKTTTIEILTGILKPTTGNAIISGFNTKTHFNNVKSVIGVVPQEISLYPTLSVLNNLLIFGTLYGIPKVKLKTKISDLLKVFGLENKAKQKVKNLSGGMKRRLNIIAGILHSPKLLILDEPTAGIDVQSKKFILQNLQELNNRGTTILYTSHYMDEAEIFCSNIAIIDQGKIIACNTPKELIMQNAGCANLEDVFLKLTGRRIRE